MRQFEAGEIVATKYRLKHPLAKGGMGSVWTAWNEQLEVPVAIKFMAIEALGSAELVARFEREAKAAAQLRIPQVVQVFEHGVFRGVPFMAMELLEGEDLGKRLRARGRLTLAETAHIVSEVCKALRRAHEHRLVHRDLKPANVFLARSGDEEVVKILDFGIVKLMSPTTEGEATKTGALIGTPNYMSPEQARRANREVDERSDLWSLGVIAFRAITGKLPFAGDDAVDVLVRICTTAAPAASSVAPDVGPAVDRFFARALASDPEQRFQSAREMSEALARVAAGAKTLPLGHSWGSPGPASGDQAGRASAPSPGVPAPVVAGAAVAPRASHPAGNAPGAPGVGAAVAPRAPNPAGNVPGAPGAGAGAAVAPRAPNPAGNAPSAPGAGAPGVGAAVAPRASHPAGNVPGAPGAGAPGVGAAVAPRASNPAGNAPGAPVVPAAGAAATAGGGYFGVSAQLIGEGGTMPLTAAAFSLAVPGRAPEPSREVAEADLLDSAVTMPIQRSPVAQAFLAQQAAQQEMRPSSPQDVRPSAPQGARSSAPQEVRPSSPHGGAPAASGAAPAGLVQIGGVQAVSGQPGGQRGAPAPTPSSPGGQRGAPAPTPSSPGGQRGAPAPTPSSPGGPPSPLGGRGGVALAERQVLVGVTMPLAAVAPAAIARARAAYASAPDLSCGAGATASGGESAGTMTSASGELTVPRQRRTSFVVWAVGAAALLVIVVVGSVVVSALSAGPESGAAPGPVPTAGSATSSKR